MKKFKLLILLILFIGFSSINAQVISIDSARTLPFTDTVTITGIVTNGSELGTIRYLEDGTAGIAAYSSSLSSVNRGDSIVITGVLKNYNYLLELDPVISHTVVSTGITMPTPQLITPNLLDENHEGELVRINNATFTTSPGGTFSSNSSYNFTSGGQSSTIYIRSGHPLIGTTIPSSSVSIIGICSQHSYSSSTTGYQLLPRDTNDIILPNTIAITSPISVSNITTSGFDLSWTTSKAGTSEIFYGNTLALGSYSTGTGGSTSHMVSISGASSGTIIYVQAFSVDGSDTAYAQIRNFATQSTSSGDIKVYFTTEVDTSVSTGINAIQLDNIMDDTAIAYINRAKYSVDFAIYNYNMNNISDISVALNQAHLDGKTVRIVYDSSAANVGMSNVLPAIGRIHSPEGSIYGIMHNKFLVIDANSANPNDPIVWTGSTNFTDGQINLDANNVIIIQDQSLARAYTLEFNEMFGSDSAQPNPAISRFGPDKTDNTPHVFIIGGKRVESYFSPSDGTNDHIIESIASADTDMHIATMLITRSDIAYAVQDASNNSVDIWAMVNSEGQCMPITFGILQSELGNQFCTDSVPGMLHHKYMIVDQGNSSSDPLVLTGCHNWSNSANNKNDENTLIVHDSTIANIYYQEFVKRFYLNNSLGINQFGSVFNLVKTYPNPSDGNFNISIKSAKNELVKIQIYDITGKSVYENQKNIITGNNLIKVNAQNLTSGIYLLNLVSDDSFYQQKLIIQ